MSSIKADISSKFEKAMDTFKDVSVEDSDQGLPSAFFFYL